MATDNTEDLSDLNERVLGFRGASVSGRPADNRSSRSGRISSTVHPSRMRAGWFSPEEARLSHSDNVASCRPRSLGTDG